MNIHVKQKIPNFQAVDQAGDTHEPMNYVGQWLLIYFYPKDNTPGCTKEACAFRDAWGELKRKNIAVLGVSINTAASHRKFIEKYELPFPLLVDDEKKLVKLFGVWGKKKFMGREYLGTKRTSFLVDPRGVVVKVYENVKPEAHAREVLNDVVAFEKQ